jgi:hypothetical protein
VKPIASRRHSPSTIPVYRPIGTKSVGVLWDRLNHPSRWATPQATIEAIMVTVRGRGVAALKEPANVERLKRCDDATKAEINRRITMLQTRGAS